MASHSASPPASPTNAFRRSESVRSETFLRSARANASAPSSPTALSARSSSRSTLRLSRSLASARAPRHPMAFARRSRTVTETLSPSPAAIMRARWQSSPFCGSDRRTSVSAAGRHRASASQSAAAMPNALGSYPTPAPFSPYCNVRDVRHPAKGSKSVEPRRTEPPPARNPRRDKTRVHFFADRTVASRRFLFFSSFSSDSASSPAGRELSSFAEATIASSTCFSKNICFQLRPRAVGAKPGRASEGQRARARRHQYASSAIQRPARSMSRRTSSRSTMRARSVSGNTPSRRQLWSLANARATLSRHSSFRGMTYGKPDRGGGSSLGDSASATLVDSTLPTAPGSSSYPRGRGGVAGGSATSSPATPEVSEVSVPVAAPGAVAVATTIESRGTPCG